MGKPKNYIEWLATSVAQQKKFEKLMSNIIFTDPEEGNPQVVTDIKGSESDFDCLVIDTENKNSKWRYKIYIEEI